MAVGAQTGEIFRMILGEGLKLSLTGLVLGIVGVGYAVEYSAADGLVI